MAAFDPLTGAAPRWVFGVRPLLRVACRCSDFSTRFVMGPPASLILVVRDVVGPAARGKLSGQRRGEYIREVRVLDWMGHLLNRGLYGPITVTG